MRKYLSMLLTLSMIVTLFAACRNNVASATESARQEAQPAEEITIAYQSSVGYAPLIVMKEQKLVEKHYNGDITVKWVEMSNGAAINEGLISGAIDVGSMGVPVAITGIQAGSPYKIAFGLSAQPYALLSNSPEINSLSDISKLDQIAITNINSQPHILLAMAARKELGDAHALDGNLTVLGNADGFAAIISGAVACHMVISPYNFMEVVSDDAEIHEIEISSDIWPPENTALVSVVPECLKTEKPEVYNALLSAVEEAMDFIEENPEDTAVMLAKGYDASSEEIQRWIDDARSSYGTELYGVMDMADFMVEEGFLAEGPTSIHDLVYENVKGG